MEHDRLNIVQHSELQIVTNSAHTHTLAQGDRQIDGQMNRWMDRQMVNRQIGQIRLDQNSIEQNTLEQIRIEQKESKIDTVDRLID